MSILSEYRRIMERELQLRYRDSAKVMMEGNLFLSSAEEVRDLTWRIAEIAKSAFVQRSYVPRYGLAAEGIAHESVSAHTNLMLALVDLALRYEYGPDFGRPDSEWPATLDGFYYNEIIEAVRVHDLAENEIGDMPDNGSRDEVKKSALENRYYQKYFAKYPSREADFKKRVSELLALMQDSVSPTGRLLYVADKTAAVLITLAYDEIDCPPMMHISDPNASPRDIEEMWMCDSVEDGYRRASEMWSIDHFHIRRIIDLDDSGFFTAIIVMYTLTVKGHWYSWREKDYQN